MSKKIGLIILLLIIVAGIFYFFDKTPQSNAQSSVKTYYMATNGSNTTGNGSATNPWLTLRYSFSRMAGGDILIVKDGVYTGDANAISTNYYPPRGNPSAWTIIKAEHDGEVLFDGENMRDMFYYGPQTNTEVYWQFEGIIWGRTISSTVVAYHARYMKFLRCGAYDAGDGNNVNFGFGTGSGYVLLENCYAWGSGRYKFLTGSSDHIIFRNSVGRLDRVNAPHEPIAVFSMYSVDDGEVQNSIAIDSDQVSAWSYAELGGGFLTPSTSRDANRINFTNCISLNNQLGSLTTTGNEYYSANDVTFQNCVFWNSSKYGGASNMLRGLRTQLLNNNFGIAISIWPYLNSYDSLAIDPSTYTTLKNSILYSIGVGTVEAYAINDIETDDYNSYYGNTFGNQERSILGANTLTTIDPIYNSLTNPNGALKYITRIEEGSSLSGQGENGADIGANVLTLVGEPGTLWGEPGFNIDTGVSMWPYPYEDLIKEKMQAYSEGGVSGNRGFAASGNGLYGGPITLTSYIWEYLGNPCPPEICSYGSTPPPSDTTPPTRGNSQPTGSLASGAISTTMSLTTNENATCKYSSLPGISYSAMTSNFSTTGATSHSITISGLQNGQSYRYYVKCIDAKNNTNPDDFAISFSVDSSAGKIYYISPNGNDTNSGTSALPWKTFAKSFSIMKAGDTLLLLDGTYSIVNGTGIISYDGANSAQPPSGTVKNITTVKAQNPGKAIVEGLFLGRSFRKDSYIKIEGIKFEGGGKLYNTSYITIKNNGFHVNSTTGSESAFSIGTNDHENGNSYNLIEDNWFWGSARVLVGNYRSDYNVWRRNIIRNDGCNKSGCVCSGCPNVTFTVYDSAHNSVQNMIILDSIDLSGQAYADFATAQHTPGAHYFGDNEWYGDLSLNSQYPGWTMEADASIDPTIRLKNDIAWDNKGASFNPSSGSFKTSTFENLTSVNPGVTNDAFRIRDMSGGYIRNLISVNAGRHGVNSNTITPSYSNVYNSFDTAYREAQCTVGCKIVNPLTDGSIKYITRIENSSVLKGAGYGGADYGANIVNRYGVNGSRYGETNYNILTNNSLWPWPNEDRIKKEMCTDVGVTRGFCGAQTLTKYIWEYLGNPCPPEICNYGSTLPPTPPNITLTLSADKTEIQSGDILTYTLAYRNTTSGSAKNIVITDPIPQGASYVAGSATNSGVYDAVNSRITWTIPTLSGNTSGAVSFKVMAE